MEISGQNVNAFDPIGHPVSILREASLGARLLAESLSVSGRDDSISIGAHSTQRILIYHSCPVKSRTESVG
uniref:Uncharacterized protein n=1 Tax=mine drainage metagenome TaxID=410659 RepID=E6QLK6_9ZZZZ